jgi:hypothetical protein
MKKLFSILMLVALITTTANAQTPFVRSRTVSSLLTQNDTLISSSSGDTIYHVYQSVGAANVTIQLDVTKLSGTWAGKAYIYGSVKGINYILIDSSTVYAANGINPAANIYSKSWVYSPGQYNFYQVITYSSGTETLLPKVYGRFTPLYNKQ